MERLTERTAAGVPNLAYPKSCYFQDGRKDPIGVSSFRQKAIDRLSAYEDTGLTPEEIKKHEEAYTEIMTRTYGPLHEKIGQWLQAEKDGRLVVLPCKVGGHALVHL